MRKFKKLLSFDWDKGNFNKNWLRHKVTNQECEEAFFDEHRFIFKDHLHSGKEERFRIIGRTKKTRFLFIVFTKRREKIRIISARDISKKEMNFYEKKVDITRV